MEKYNKHTQNHRYELIIKEYNTLKSLLHENNKEITDFTNHQLKTYKQHLSYLNNLEKYFNSITRNPKLNNQYYRCLTEIKYLNKKIEFIENNFT